MLLIVYYVNQLIHVLNVNKHYHLIISILVVYNVNQTNIMIQQLIHVLAVYLIVYNAINQIYVISVNNNIN